MFAGYDPSNSQDLASHKAKIKQYDKYTGYFEVDNPRQTPVRTEVILPSVPAQTRHGAGQFYYKLKAIIGGGDKGKRIANYFKSVLKRYVAPTNLPKLDIAVGKDSYEVNKKRILELWSNIKSIVPPGQAPEHQWAICILLINHITAQVCEKFEKNS